LERSQPENSQFLPEFQKREETRADKRKAKKKEEKGKKER
jgi:hypothetical protein